MNLKTLERYDRATANGALAAAVLTIAHDPGLDDAYVLRKYKKEAEEILEEIRSELRLKPGPITAADSNRFSEALANAIAKNVLPDGSPTDALARAGQSGRLPPSLYVVRQPQAFIDKFYRYGLKKKAIEDAIHRPDDLQHLMNDRAVEQDVISLFMKRMEAREPHWLLVQTHRKGVEQVAQSAWRIYPSDVDLTSADRPVDVLKAFVGIFGLPVELGGKTYKFIEDEAFEGPAAIEAEVKFHTPPHTHHFLSLSAARSVSGGMKIGVAYCVDLGKYDRSLRRRGFDV